MTSGSEMAAEVLAREGVAEMTSTTGQSCVRVNSRQYWKGQDLEALCTKGTLSWGRFLLTQAVTPRAASHLGWLRARWGEKQRMKDELAAAMTADNYGHCKSELGLGRRRVSPLSLAWCGRISYNRSALSLA